MKFKNAVSMSDESVFILGGGFIGKPLAISLNNSGREVKVVLRSNTRKPEYDALNISTIVTQIGIDPPLQTNFSNCILVIAYPIKSRSLPAASHLEQAQWIFRSFPKYSVGQVILTSSTSVYPDGCGLVDESFSDFDLSSEQLQYERELEGYYGNQMSIFRLAGLVGPGRNPGKFLAGRDNLPNANSPVNMVHQGDVVRFIVAAINKGTCGEIFNLCHDEHPTREVYYTKASERLDLAVPKFNEVQIASPKIVANQKAKEYFDMTYAFDIE